MMSSLDDELQDKNNQIDILTDNLEKERMRLHDMQKAVSDVREELDIQTQRSKLVADERDL